jgi:hypothetical protein
MPAGCGAGERLNRFAHRWNSGLPSSQYGLYSNH